MGGGGQPKNTTTTTETKIPDWLANDYQQFIGQTNAQNAKPYQSYGGQLNAGLSQGQQQALQYAQGGASGNQAQQQYLQQLLGGSQSIQYQKNPYAGSDSQLNAVINNSTNDITDKYNRSTALSIPTQFAQGGAFGGSAQQQAQSDANLQLAKAIDQTATGLRYQDYNNQADRWQQGFQNQLAASQNNATNILGASNALNGANALQAQYNGQLAGLGQVQQDYAQGNIDQAYNDWYQKNYGYDQQKLNNYGNALNAVSGNFTGSQVSGANPAYKPRTAGGGVASAASGALAGAAAGSVIPGLGTVAGGVIGGAAGAIGYYL